MRPTECLLASPLNSEDVACEWLCGLKVKVHVQAVSEAPGAAAGNSSAAAGTGATGIPGSKIGGGVKAMLGSLLPERGA